MMADAEVDRSGVRSAGFRFVRHNDANETVICSVRDEQAELADIVGRSAEFGTRLDVQGDRISVALHG